MKKNLIIVCIILIVIMALVILLNIYNNAYREIDDSLARITFSKEEILKRNSRFESFYGINNSEQIKRILEQCKENFAENCEDGYAELKIPRIKYITEPDIVTLNFDEHFNGNEKEQEYYVGLNNILENISSDKSYNVDFKYTTSLTEPGDDVSLIREIDIVEFDGTEENLNTILQIHEAELADKKKTERYTEKVTIELKEDSVSKNGATIIITDNNEAIYTWNDIYFIEQKVGNMWEKIETIEKMPDEKNYNVDQNNQIILEMDWMPYYGELPNGIYRIVKIAHDSTEIVEFRSNGFEITD